MQKIHANLEYKTFDKPSSGLTTVSVCMDSGLRPTDACEQDLRGSRVHTVTVATGTEPTESCHLHVLKEYCTVGKTLAGPNCPKEDVELKAFLDYKRTDYGGIVADDNAYLLSTMEALGECPVHTQQAADNPDTGSDTPGTDTDPGTDGGTTTPSEEQPTTPTEPGNGETTTTPSENSEWWDNIWNGN